MRHFFSPRPVAACPLGMRAPSPMAGLVTRAGGALTPPPGEIAAVSGAVDLATVATATDQGLGAAFRANKQPRRGGLAGIGSVDTAAWTAAAVGAILSLHTCPARCGARRRVKPPSLRSAPCLVPQKLRLLRHVRQQVSGPQSACLTPSRQRTAAVAPADPGSPSNPKIAG
jgi:hypothetical protein